MIRFPTDNPIRRIIHNQYQSDYLRTWSRGEFIYVLINLFAIGGKCHYDSDMGSNYVYPNINTLAHYPKASSWSRDRRRKCI